eukprot:GHVH01006627.1.p1 GENE.GHVH01006627.1~~GHVH01006627.1.p1  ORF type:complete len:538 (+),score=54.18 GHVH01006627.1:24-1637(+)
MIIYRRRGLAKHGILCRCNGTVIIRTLPWAMLSTLIAWLLYYFDWPSCTDGPLDQNTCGIKHPGAFQWYFSLSTFMLAFNSSNAFQRYWEARTHLQTCTSQLALLGTHIIAMSTPSVLHNKEIIAESDQHSDRVAARQSLDSIAVYRAKCLHMATLLHALMMMYLLNQDWTENMEVLGGLTFAESQALSRCNDQVYLVESWLSELIIQAHTGNRVLCKQSTPPIAAQHWVLLNSVMTAFMGICKVEDTPFPYPYQQLMGLMAAVNVILIPFFAANIIWDFWYKIFISTLVSFLYRAIYETILISELPFGSKPNDLPFRLIHHQFVSRMRDLVDKDTYEMLKEWNLLFTLSEVIVCRDGITTFAPWTNRRVPMHELLDEVGVDFASSDGSASYFEEDEFSGTPASHASRIESADFDGLGSGRKKSRSSRRYYRQEVHSIWKITGDASTTPRHERVSPTSYEAQSHRELTADPAGNRNLNLSDVESQREDNDSRRCIIPNGREIRMSEDRKHLNLEGRPVQEDNDPEAVDIFERFSKSL